MAGRIESALHDPTEEQEVRSAMESVFLFSMLAQFLTLPRSDKEMQLCELPYIVVGICLFNQATGSSEGKALTTALESSLSVDTSALLKSCEDHIHTITRALHCYTGAIQTFHLEVLHHRETFVQLGGMLPLAMDAQVSLLAVRNVHPECSCDMVTIFEHSVLLLVQICICPRNL